MFYQMHVNKAASKAYGLDPESATQTVSFKDFDDFLELN